LDIKSDIPVKIVYRLPTVGEHVCAAGAYNPVKVG